MLRIRKQILQSLVEGEISIYQLIDLQDASLPEFFKLIQEMEKEKMVLIRNGRVSLTKKGVEACKAMGVRSVKLSCEYCNGTGYGIKEFFKEVLKEYKRIAENRPETVEKYDQGFISVDGVIRRVEFIYERGDLFDSRMFIVGDDDLLSIAAALTGLPKRIFVVEIDERLVSFIDKKADEYGLPIQTMVYDVQQSFPTKLRKKFHVFVTDPVETILGLKLFLSRCISSLKGKGCAGYFGITTLEASSTKWYELEKMIHNMGFIITDLRRRFSIYPNEDKNFFRFQDKLPIVSKLGVKVDHDWYTSTLFRIEAVKEPKPIVEGEMVVDEKIYKDNESWATPY
jgi:hypothetical protein